MRLGSDSAYGVFATAQVATERAPISGDDLMESCGIPAEMLSVILPKLVEAGIFRREAGPRQVFALAKPADRITLLHIVEAIEGRQEPELLLPSHAGLVVLVSAGHGA